MQGLGREVLRGGGAARRARGGAALGPLWGRPQKDLGGGHRAAWLGAVKRKLK